MDEHNRYEYDILLRDGEFCLNKIFFWFLSDLISFFQRGSLA